MTRSAAALVLYIFWFTFAFGLRSIVQLQRTGATGFNGISGQPRSLEWWAGVLFIVALVLGVAAPAAGLAGWLQPVPMLTETTAARIGVVAAVGGMFLTLAAQSSMGDSWRIGVDRTERTDLVRAGAFLVCRNPIFTAMAVTGVGLAFLVGNALALIGFAALILALELQVRFVEEPYLLATHPDEYGAYARRVGRFVPLVGRIRTPEKRAP